MAVVVGIWVFIIRIVMWWYGGKLSICFISFRPKKKFKIVEERDIKKRVYSKMCIFCCEKSIIVGVKLIISYTFYFLKVNIREILFIHGFCEVDK